MRLLVTRPEPDAGETADRLAAMGHEVVRQPMLRILLEPQPEALPDPAALIATSRNGIRALAGWPAAADWRARPLFVTGAGTAAEAAAAGFADIRPGGADATALATRIAREMTTEAGPLLHVAGRDRTAALEAALRAAGHDLRIVEGYRAEAVTALDPAVAAALREGRIDGVLIFSGRTAAAFRAAAEAAGIAGPLAATTVYAISGQAVEPLRPVARDIRIAANPDFDGIAVMIGRAGPT